jgi:hypothetical protein
VKTVELTFDDGPDPRWTPQVLDALAAARLRAEPLRVRLGRVPWPAFLAC